MLLIRFLLLFSLSCSAQTPEGGQRPAEHATSLSASAPPLFASGVRAILQDDQGHYWFGSHQDGVCRYDGSTITYYGVRDGLADPQVRSIQEDAQGRIWFATANGVSVYEAGQGIRTVLPTTTPGAWRKTGQDLWFHAGNRPGVYRWDGQTLQYLAYPVRPEGETTAAYLTTCSAGGRNGTLWLGTYGGFFGFDGDRFTLLNNETLDLRETGGVLHVRSLLEDSKGRLWIGNNGIGVLLKEGDSIHNFSDRRHLIHPFSARSGAGSPPGTLEHVFAIGEDLQGHIWFGDRDTGIWRYDGQTMTNYPTIDGQPMPMTWCMHQDRQGNLLFGMANGFVYRFNGEGFERAF